MLARVEAAYDGQDIVASRAEVEGLLRRELIGGLVDGERRGGSLYVGGPPGIGKTHVIGSILDQLEASSGDDVVVLRASGDDGRGDRAFGVIAELAGEIPAGAHPAEVLLDSIAGFASVRSVAVWIDDAHHADGASLRVVQRLIRMARALPLLVVVSGTIAGYLRTPAPIVDQVDRVRHLPAMDGPAARQVVVEHTGRLPGPGLATALCDGTGNPGFIIDILRCLDETGQLADGPAGTVDLANGGLQRTDELDRVVRVHFEDFDGLGRAVLAALAVCATSVEIGVLSEILFTDEVDLDAALDSVLASGFVRHMRGGRLDFALEVYREIVYDAIDPDSRRMAHQRVAHVAARRGLASVDVAHHLLRGRSADMDAAVIRHLRAAAADTEHYVGAALPAGSADADVDYPGAGVDPDGKSDDLLRRVHRLVGSGRAPAAEELICDRMRTVTEWSVAAELQLVLVDQLINRAQTHAAAALIERLADLDLPGDVDERLTLARLRLTLLSGQFPSTTELAHIAATAATAGWTSVIQMCRVLVATRLVAAGAPTAGMRELSPTAAPDVTDLTWAGSVTCALATLQRDGPRAARRLVTQIRQHNCDDRRWADPYIGMMSAVIAVVEATWDDAVAESDTAIELADDVGSGWISAAVGYRAYIAAHRGDTVSARATLDAFRHRRLPLHLARDVPGVAEVALLTAEGATDEALSLTRSLWSASRLSPGLGLFDHATELMRVALQVGDRRLAEQIGADVAAGMDAAASADSVAEPTVRLCATAAHARGLLCADPTALAEAAGLFESAGFRWQQAQALEELACVAATSGDRDSALSAADGAMAIYAVNGARVDIDRLSARLRTLGLRRGPRDVRRARDGRGDRLTATELRVAMLVREGMTNREIGARMYISPRTVQTHVSHILAKTGLRSRVEVAASSPDRWATPIGGHHVDR
ncbi:LuxR family transcriptional regulator [Gordonia jinhuaensis]|uniref:LuxR family transcriptional regulator n=1 Tax=Gordonia jinhuaensis TaxID=1517702 RepID=A0A916T3H9_9ACTN|nr:LuxR family transcriptional regulator [Gordonia jinhuaensis]